MPYTAFKITDTLWRLDDGRASSFYLLQGTSSALLVDTGMADEPLVPFLRTLTDLPITVLITHGHGDHVAHAGEFQHVYMSPRDLPFLDGAFHRLSLGAPPDALRFLPLEDGQRLDLHDFAITCIPAGGHSPGSMVFYEEKHHVLFTGDAVGSGIGVWMQLTGCLPVRAYREALEGLAGLWRTLPADTMVLSGHFDQRYYHPSGDNPVCLELVEDMIALCGQILDRKEDRQPAPEVMVRGIQPVYTASFGRASMVYTDQVL